jgi:hypothetical protein
MLQKRDQVIKRFDLVELGGVNEAHKQVADIGAVLSLVEKRIFAMQNGLLKDSFTNIMPTTGLCRMGVLSRCGLRHKRYFRSSPVGIIRGFQGRRVGSRLDDNEPAARQTKWRAQAPVP